MIGCATAWRRTDDDRGSGAILVFENGLEVNELAEECYRHLMRCYQSLDRCTEAISVYQRCRKTLAAVLGISPAPETEALYQALRQK